MPGFEIGITNATDIESFLACQQAGWPLRNLDPGYLRFRVEDSNFDSLRDVGLLLNDLELTDDPAMQLPAACIGEFDTETRCWLQIERTHSKLALIISNETLARYDVHDITVFAPETTFLAVRFDDDVGFDHFELCPAPRIIHSDIRVESQSWGVEHAHALLQSRVSAVHCATRLWAPSNQ